MYDHYSQNKCYLKACFFDDFKPLNKYNIIIIEKNNIYIDSRTNLFGKTMQRTLSTEKATKIQAEIAGNTKLTYKLILQRISIPENTSLFTKITNVWLTNWNRRSVNSLIAKARE